MKRMILLAMLVTGIFGASAEIRFGGIDNNGATHIVLIDKEAPETVEITEALLTNDGKTYRARQIRCDVMNGTAVYRLQFKRLTVFRNCRVTLTVNGERKTVDIQRNLLDR